jgi:hypothetical protein
MPATTPRNRLVVFRLSQDEYDALKDACAERKGRNLSDFTRTELLATVRSDSLDHLMRKGFSEVDKRLEALRGSVAALASWLEGNTASGRSSSPTIGENK